MSSAFAFPTHRSSVMARNGMVATSQPLAAQTGLDVLRRGGNAIDAAIAAIAVMCVVEPCSTGIGGDAFALIWSADDQQLVGINGSGPAGSHLDAAALRAQLAANGLPADKIPPLGGHTVTVPGSLRAWELALARFGTRSLDELLSDAIHYAADGFPVSPIIARQWQMSTAKMSRHPDSKRVWVPGGRAPSAGERFRNPEFAATLQTIAAHGVEAFYTGAIADQIVATVAADGGFLTHDDLASYRAAWVDSIAADYTNGAGETFTFHEIPPNGQGLTALLALNVVDRFDVRGLNWGSVDYWHLLIEAIKLGFADAAAYIADPKHASIPLDGLLSAAYAAERAALIDPTTAGAPAAGDPPLHGDTVYLTVADGAGNMVSWIQSLYMGFGSGLTAGRTGVQLQNRGANFSLVPGHPNEAAPGKRPYHTIIPGFITRDGQPYASFGVMGGFMQPQGHLQVGLNLIEFDMDAQTALDAPRFYWQAGKRVAMEDGIPPGVQGALTGRGHEKDPRSRQQHYGGGQVIVRRPDGTLIGGTEPRKDGVVAAWGNPPAGGFHHTVRAASPRSMQLHGCRSGIAAHNCSR